MWKYMVSIRDLIHLPAVPTPISYPLNLVDQSPQRNPQTNDTNIPPTFQVGL